MSVRAFLDTNIFVYSTANEDLVKRDRARELIARVLGSGEGRASYQVAQEFLNVAVRKYRRTLNAADALELVKEIIVPMIQDSPDIGLFEAGLELHERFQVSLYNGLIVASARRQKCSVIYSEDLRSGIEFIDVRVVNPFT